MSRPFTYTDLQDGKVKLTELGKLHLKDCYMAVWHTKTMPQAEVWFEAVQQFLLLEKSAKDRNDNREGSSDR